MHDASAAFDRVYRPARPNRDLCRPPVSQSPVSVLVPVAVAAPYTYAAPPGLAVALGDIVEVPLGTRNVVGVVWDDPPDREIGHNRLRPIAARLAATG